MSNIFYILRALDELEDSVSLLYDKFSNLFSYDKEAQFFFYKMSMDEIAHRDIVKYQTRILTKLNPKELKDIDIDIKEIQDLIQYTVDLLFAEKEWTIQEAVAEAVKLETNAAERHYKSLLTNINPELSILLKHLGKDDEEHIRQLKEFAQKYIN